MTKAKIIIDKEGRISGSTKALIRIASKGTLGEISTKLEVFPLCG